MSSSAAYPSSGLGEGPQGVLKLIRGSFYEHLARQPSVSLPSDSLTFLKVLNPPLLYFPLGTYWSDST